VPVGSGLRILNALALLMVVSIRKTLVLSYILMKFLSSANLTRNPWLQKYFLSETVLVKKIIKIIAIIKMGNMAFDYYPVKTMKDTMNMRVESF
jgi:hypothetical protein